MKYKLENLFTNYQLLLTGISFLIFFIMIIDDSIAYFFQDKFYEGFALIIPIIIFCLYNIVLIFPYILKKDFKGLGVFILINFVFILISFIGFTIPLVILPLLSLSLSFHYILLGMKINSNLQTK